MTKIRPLTALTLAGFAAFGVLAAYTLNAQASVEIRQLGQPVEGEFVRDFFGNTIGFETFSGGATASLVGSAEMNAR